MASGDTLFKFTPASASFPLGGAGNPAPDTRNDHPILKFDATIDETIDFADVLSRSYTGGGMTATVYWAATTAEIGETRWALSWERIQPGVTNLDSDSFAAVQIVDATAPLTSGITSEDEIIFSDGAQIDGLLVGEAVRLRFQRLGSSGSDTMSGDAEWTRLEIRET